LQSFLQGFFVDANPINLRTKYIHRLHKFSQIIYSTPLVLACILSYFPLPLRTRLLILLLWSKPVPQQSFTVI